VIVLGFLVGSREDGAWTGSRFAFILGAYLHFSWPYLYFIFAFGAPCKSVTDVETVWGPRAPPLVQKKICDGVADRPSEASAREKRAALLLYQIPV
jgi:hypothetical protein